MSLPEILLLPSPCEIAVARLIKAPPALVFQAWTDPVGISNWWGPRGFSTTTLGMDVRPGGKWRHIMHGPDGRDYESEIESLASLVTKSQCQLALLQWSVVRVVVRPSLCESRSMSSAMRLWM